MRFRLIRPTHSFLIHGQITLAVNNPDKFLRHVIQISYKLAVGNACSMALLHTAHIIAEDISDFFCTHAHLLLFDIHRVLLEELVEHAADNQSKDNKHRRKIQREL